MDCQRLLPGFTLTLPEHCPEPLQQVAELFRQDCLRVFNQAAQADSGTLVVRFAQGEAEQWRLHADDAQTCVITASDTRGAISALLSLSRHGLGIDPWQHWLELPDPQRPYIDLEAVPQASIPSPTRYRGWFINDEILLRGWTTKQLDQQAAWKLACQTLLRLGGNLIIPGTMDLAPRNWALAESYDLIITHNHHEPLGSHMVLRSLKPFPDDFRYADHLPALQAGWRDAVARQQGGERLWAIGFRGHGDYPFWQDDRSYSTDASRGEMTTTQVAHQAAIVREQQPDAMLCANIYGEVTSLYRKGLIRLPGNCVRIWADNGYGAQLSRHTQADGDDGDEGGERALPEGADATENLHGIYTHVTFNDRRAANHLLPWTQDPQWVVDHFAHTTAAGANDLILVNCGNIRPHIQFLDLWAELWQQGPAIDVAAWQRGLAKRLAPTEADELVKAWQAYAAARQPWGPEDWATIGDQFHHKHLRYLIQAAVQAVAQGDWSACAEFSWLDGLEDRQNDRGLVDQIAWFGRTWEAGVSPWQQAVEIIGSTSLRIQQLVGGPARIQLHAHRAGAALCRALVALARGHHAAAWLHCHGAQDDLKAQVEELERIAGDGIWRGLYDQDGQTNVRASYEAVCALASHLRLVYAGDKLHLNWTKQYGLQRDDHPMLACSRLNVEVADLAERLHRYLPADEWEISFS